MKRSILSCTVIVALALPAVAEADRRIFGYTYPYQTLPEGTLELEHYLDLGLGAWDDPATPDVEDDWTETDWRHQIEFEYGITDHLDFGFYNVFRQKPYGSLGYEGVKLRSRYRFGERGDRVVDPALYLEVGYFGDSVKLEEMVILSKEIGRVELSFNGKLEQKYEIDDRKWELEFLPIAGVGYHLSRRVSVALEYYGKLEVADGEAEYYVSYLGPALSVAGRGFYWTVAVQPQLGSRDGLAGVQVRSLFGVVL